MSDFGLGTWVQINSATVVEIIGNSNFDFVVIDLEHGNISLESLENLLRAAKLSGLETIVRVYENNSSLIMRVLDLGPDGILVPHVSSKEDAVRVVQSAKYPPLGDRGSCPCIPEANHWTNDWTSFMEQSNRDTEIIALVEGQHGMNHFQEIIEVDGIDTFMIGPFDLSVSLGIPGDSSHPLIEEKYNSLIELVEKQGKELIGVDFSYEMKAIQSNIEKWRQRGVTRMMTGIDKMFVTKMMKEVGNFK
ncbi:HpcH/HpaI aldolase family protein [Oceanobacillus halotolerans]|uniref:HpcH/HpaI aldolase family protein n=1 Tax=Oceanobacillus halotolerans TaxID=2663380 RepID=UPI0013D9F76E|nr:aldolase/citrate lyase family protein [Oceanobacillus halotolerans]